MRLAMSAVEFAALRALREVTLAWFGCANVPTDKEIHFDSSIEPGLPWVAHCHRGFADQTSIAQCAGRCPAGKG